MGCTGAHAAKSSDAACELRRAHVPLLCWQINYNIVTRVITPVKSSQLHGQVVYKSPKWTYNSATNLLIELAFMELHKRLKIEMAFYNIYNRNYVYLVIHLTHLLNDCTRFSLISNRVNKHL